MTQANQTVENATVALVRSPKANANDITDDEVRRMVREAVALTGGFSDMIKDGQLVVVKPNLVSPRVTAGTIDALTMVFTDPYKKKEKLFPQKANGATADWRVAKALVELVREVNPSGKVYVMECSGEGQVAKNFELLGYTHKNIPGVDKFIGLDETAGGFRDIDSPDLVAVDLKDKQQYKKLPKYLNNKYYFDKTYYSADVIISLCCLKNHSMAAITGGIKNVGIGAMPGKTYGCSKKQINRAMTINHAWAPLNNFIHDYYIAKPVQFVLTDGLQGTAYGPHCQGAPSYEDAKMNMRLLLASKDPVACDTVHSCIVGVDPEKVDYLKDVSRRGLGNIDTKKITVVGNARVDEVKKPFPFAKGLARAIWGEPSKKVYTDFSAPEFSIKSVSIKENEIFASLEAASEIIKIEMFIDDKLLQTFTEDFNQIHTTLEEPISKDYNKISFRAFDRFLNCSIISNQCRQAA